MLRLVSSSERFSPRFSGKRMYSSAWPSWSHWRYPLNFSLYCLRSVWPLRPLRLASVLMLTGVLSISVF